MFELFNDNIQPIAIMQLAFLFLLFLYLVWDNRNIFLVYFCGNKISTIFLFIAIVFFVFLNMSYGFSGESFIPSDEEWVLVDLARNIMEGENIFHSPYLRYGMVYPMLLSGSFYLFDMVSEAASYLNLFLSIISIILVYIISLVLFDKESSLFSAVLYIFSPMTFVFTSLQMGFPMISAVALLAFVLASLLLFKYHTYSFLMLSIVALLICSQVKPEYIVLILPFLIYFFWRKEYRHFSIKILLFVTLFFAFFTMPYYVKNLQLTSQLSGFQCGAPSLYSDYKTADNLSFSLLAKSDNFIREKIHGQFAISHLFRKLPNFVNFWSFRLNIIIVLLALYGMIYLYYEGKKGYGYVLLIYVFISIMYLSHCAYYTGRYLFPSYSLVVIIAGFGIRALNNALEDKIKIFKKIFIIVLIMYIVAYFYIEFFPYFSKKQYHDHLFGFRVVQSDYADLKNIVSDMDKETANIIILHPNEEYALKLQGYSAYSLINIYDGDYSTINYDNAITNLKVPVKAGMDNYFIRSSYCDYLPENKIACNFIHENHKLELVKRIDSENVIYRFID